MIRRVFIAVIAASCVLMTSLCHAQDSREEKIEKLREMIEEMQLEGDEARVLRDALKQIVDERGERDDVVKRESDDNLEDDSDKKKVNIDINIDDESLEAFERHIEEHAEQFAESMERWAKDFEEHVETWAEQYGEDMEAWAEDFGNSWEEWAEAHGEDWEDWGKEFAERWETWSDTLEGGNIDEDDIKRLVESNKDLIREMPLESLYEQLSKTKEQLHDLPWEHLEGVEELVAKSIEQGLEGIERARGIESDEMKEATEELRRALKLAQEGLARKKFELQEARGDALSALARATEAERAAAAALLDQVAEQDPLATPEKTELQRQVYAEALKALENAEVRKESMRIQELIMQHQDRAQALQADQHRAAVEQLREAAKQRALRQEMSRAVEIDEALRAKQEEKESQLFSLREEIQKLRAEVAELREVKEKRE